jgi:hypothetical protein
MGRLIIDSRSMYLIDTSNRLSKETIKLIDEATKLSNESDDNIFIALDISETEENDLSIMVVSKVIGEKIEILYCKNETYYK